MRTKEPNNFINLIINSVYKARNFKQQFRFTITSKEVLKSITLRFYIRKRYNEVYLYTRIYKNNFGNNKHQYEFLKSILGILGYESRINEIQILSTQGHYKGILINTQYEDILNNFLKLISYLANFKSFEVKETTHHISFKNKVESSTIPIHFRVLKSNYNKIIGTEIYETINSSLHNTITNSINSNTSTSDE